MSPALHEEEGRHHGLRVHYQLIDLDAAGVGLEVLPELMRAVRIMGFAGLNITFPCKQAVIPLLDSLSDEARAISAVNTVVREGTRLVGHNTDASGWSWGFQRALPRADLSRVVLLGAGGAGAAVAHAARSLGIERLRIVDVDEEAARALAERVGGTPGELDDVEAANGLIHATPVGMAAHPGLPLPAELLRGDLWVADVVYRPLETELLRRARELDAHLHIDMESYDSREVVTDLVLELLGEEEFRDGLSAGLVLQAYLRDSPQLLERIIAWARATPRERPLVVRQYHDGAVCPICTVRLLRWSRR
jgi:shikimate dehydrogenase